MPRHLTQNIMKNVNFKCVREMQTIFFGYLNVLGMRTKQIILHGG